MPACYPEHRRHNAHQGNTEYGSHRARSEAAPRPSQQESGDRPLRHHGADARGLAFFEPCQEPPLQTFVGLCPAIARQPSFEQFFGKAVAFLILHGYLPQPCPGLMFPGSQGVRRASAPLQQRL